MDVKISLEQFGRDLKDSLSNALPTSFQPYTKVAVLLMHWSNDDMDVAGLEDELATVFQRIYNYHTENFIIPAAAGTAGAKRALLRKLLNFIDTFDGSKHLLIYVYSGYVTGKETECYLKGSWDSDVKADWMMVRSVCDSAVADTLHIMDACYSSVAAINGNNELLAACATESQATSELNRSFTLALINELGALRGSPVTVAHLHALMVHNTLEHKLTATPVHVQLSKELKHSIMLQRVSDDQGIPVVTAQAPSRHKVLLSTSLVDGDPLSEVQEWENWLVPHIRPLAQDIDVKVSVEGLFSSNSLFLIVSLPLILWSTLRTHPAYKFLGFVHSRNLRLGEEETSSLWHHSQSRQPQEIREN